MFISHRINYLDENIAQGIFSQADGIEFDIRDSNGEIIVQHDAFQGGQPFADFLKYCPFNKIYIVNVKSEGIEECAIKLLELNNIFNFFLLDCSIPMMVKLGKIGEHRLAVRFSEFESLETVEAMAPFVKWVWVDVFTKLPLTKAIEERIHKLGLMICLVSPELQKQQDKVKIYKEHIQKENIRIDAVCSKQYNKEIWME